MVLNIDVKPNNDPQRLFTLMRTILSQHDKWETTLAPRLILGLWHPKFIPAALSLLPSLKRCFIGIDLDLAQAPVFWDACHAYSIAFPMLATAYGAAFRARCRQGGKELYTWTLNSQEEWVTSAEWGVDVVMTDTPLAYLDVRRAMSESSTPIAPLDPWFAWKHYKYYTLAHWFFRSVIRKRLERFGGPLAPYLAVAPAALKED